MLSMVEVLVDPGPLRLNPTNGVLVPTANHKPRRGAELVGVAQRPASAIGGHHDHRAEDHPCQGWTVGVCQALGNVSQTRAIAATTRPARTASSISGQKRGVFGIIKRELRRRSAIEAVIGHMKTDGHLGRCCRKGPEGDAANVILTAVGHNLRLVLAWLSSLLRLILLAYAEPSASRPRANGLLNGRHHKVGCILPLEHSVAEGKRIAARFCLCKVAVPPEF